MKGAEFLRLAQTHGLIDDAQTWPTGRPWPVVLMTALGAWLAAVPLLGAAGALFGMVFERALGLYGVGAAALALALWLLRERGQPLFVEQLGLPTLLAGLLCIGVRLTQDLPGRAAMAVMAVLCLALAWVLGRAWLRVLLGAAAAALLLAALRGAGWGRDPLWPWALVVLAAVGGLWGAPWPKARQAAWADAVGVGAAALLLAALALDAGMSWLVAGMGPIPWDWSHRVQGGWALAAAPVALAAAGALAWRWPLLRGARWGAVALLLALASAVLPALAVLAALATVAALQQRWRLVAAAAVAALWVLGSFYYRMDWPLQTKALGLVALASLLAGVARWPGDARAAAVPLARGRSLGLLAAALGGLLLVNFGIAQKERWIAQGEPLFVELAPADPRSLMQGDYMRLNYQLLSAVGEQPPLPGGRRPLVVVRRDADGVARFVRHASAVGELAPDERLLELSPKDGRWTVVSDAWFFKEGEAARWQAARYAELRVLPNGRALLVGLRGEGLKPL